MPLGYGTFCPFLTVWNPTGGVDGTGAFVYSNCMNESCVFWDEPARQEYEDNTGSTSGKVFCIKIELPELESVDDKISTIVSQVVNNIWPMMSHIHKQHEHQYPHSEANTTSSTGGMNMFPNFNPALVLLNEFMTGQDMDGNGEVYGTDFGLKSLGKPEMLSSIEANPSFRNPKKKIKFSDYCEWIIGKFENESLEDSWDL